MEYEPQTRREGEIQQLHGNHPVTEIWRVFKGIASARKTDHEVTIFDSVGFAIEDFSTLRYIEQKARLHDVGYDIELVPNVDDPKDLFGQTKRRRVALKKVA